MNRDSERIPRRLRPVLTSELEIDFHSYGEDSPRLAAGRVQIRYIDRDGQTKTWQMAPREKTGPKCFTRRLASADAVVIVPYHRERQQLVVIREFRIAFGGFQYGFPAGLVDPWELVEMAVRRELMEETGLTVVR
ncbi:NUDIX domain-containing protein [uncultured Desulfosarcina sp.]|uniref:NUDIX hydrolase n=1 Tax=uncultured Desulfosarcina sp. TaxID=218289 RepID=UPI0029C6A328|nr:NUDIX domain-containing protein [uncultured Desulfosarcina sp.]